MDERQKEMHLTAQRARMESALPIVQVLPTVSPASPAAEAATAVGAMPDMVTEPAANLANAMQTLRTFGEDKTAKKTYIASLPDKLQLEVMQALKTQKEQAAQLANQRNAELDDLL